MKRGRLNLLGFYLSSADSHTNELSKCGFIGSWLYQCRFTECLAINNL